MRVRCSSNTNTRGGGNMSVTFWFILLFLGFLILALAEESFVTRETEHDLIANDDSSVENNIAHGKHDRAPLYHHVGCFLDKPVRALSYSGLTLRSGSPAERINKCAVFAFNRGYDTFGMQLGGECFTGPSARHTYRVYGAIRGCSNGLGGIFRNDIYFLDMRKGRSFSRGNWKWCCGNRRFNPRTQTCCLNGEVVQQNFSCTPCNNTFYNENKFICCNGTFLLRRKYGFNSRCCGVSLVYNRNINGCCGRRLYRKASHKCCKGCCGRTKIMSWRKPCNFCGGKKYNPNRYICCSGKTLLRRNGKFTRCCGYKTYSYQSHICCRFRQTAKIQRRHAALKCCRTKIYNKYTKKCCINNGFIVPKYFTCSTCAGRPYNPFKSICCGPRNDKVLKRKKFGWKTRCCQKKTYYYKRQKCCKGNIHGISTNGTTTYARCCGSGVYDTRLSKCCRSHLIFPKTYSCIPCALKNFYNPREKICCRGTLFNMTYGSSSSCCSAKLYDARRFKCCNRRELKLKSNNCRLPLCGKRPYNETTQICCNGHAIFRRLFGPKTGCCVYNNTLTIYHLKRQKCCFGMPIANIDTCFPDGINCTADMDVSRYICCGNKKHLKSFGENSDCCGGIVYDSVHEICCDGVPSPINTGHLYKCCGRSSYDTNVAQCCIGNIVIPKCGRCPNPQ